MRLIMVVVVLGLAPALAACGTCEAHGNNGGGAGRCTVLSVPM